MLIFSVLNHLMLKIQLTLRQENKYPSSTDGIYRVTHNGYLNICYVSTCILKPNVNLQKKIDKKVYGTHMQIWKPPCMLLFIWK